MSKYILPLTHCPVFHIHGFPDKNICFYYPWRFRKSQGVPGRLSEKEKTNISNPPQKTSVCTKIEHRNNAILTNIFSS
jgi:hypothetical protein